MNQESLRPSYVSRGEEERIRAEALLVHETGQSRALLVYGPVAMALLYARGMYAERLRSTVLDTVVPIGGTLSVAAMGLALLDIYAGGANLAPAVFVHAWALSVSFVGLGRLALVVAQRSARLRGVVISQAYPCRPYRQHLRRGRSCARA